MRRRQILQKQHEERVASKQAPLPRQTLVIDTIECPICHKPYKKRGLGSHIKHCKGGP